MHFARDIILLIAAVAALASLARKLGRTAPLILVAGGVLASLLPIAKDVRIDSEVILVGFLPPLLYATAIRTSLVDFRANMRPIALLSVGLVVFTMVGVAIVAWLVLPISFPAALALGAVVAPPDAVAATAVARRVGMPRRAVTILEGESLVNDATAIVCLRASVAAIAGSVSALEVTGDFARSVLGGVAVGLIFAIVVGKIRTRIDDTVTDTTVSLVTPFAVYLAAEEIHGSGVLAVVIAGLLLGHKAERIQSARSRLFERGNWSTVQFVLENTVFFLVGLQARTILSDVNEGSLSVATIVAGTGAVLVAVIALRFVWVFATSGRRANWRVLTLVGWAGMRGVVTLAAVLVIPPETPHREVLVLIAWVVAAGTLLIQGSTLPAVVRRLGLRGPDPATDALLEARLHQSATAAGLLRLDQELTGAEPQAVVDRLRATGLERADAQWERLGGSGETPSETYGRLRQAMLDAERADVLQARSSGDAPHEILQRVLGSLDVEESVLMSHDRWNSADRTEKLVATGRADTTCEHLAAAAVQECATPLSQQCDDCVREGTNPVHLRICVSCGNVACCDSSSGRHAERHFLTEGHPVMRSFEPGEAWLWCYVDSALG